ncbi:unnamed protein product [Orchesella dallaii]|uniref:Uncharacterized protein n=1 Tax=Orchesella dallaii TaxID=48710 RepID=A0ABP1S826_9HEXA
MGAFADIILLTCALTLSRHVTEFITPLKLHYWHDVKDQDCVTVEKIEKQMWHVFTRQSMEAYNSLQQFANLINAAVGDTLLFFIGEGMFAYAIDLDYFLNFSKLNIELAHYSTTFTCILFVAANISRQMKTLNFWLHEYGENLTLSGRQLTLLLDSIEKDSVAMEMTGISNVNFSLIGKVKE